MVPELSFARGAVDEDGTAGGSRRWWMQLIAGCKSGAGEAEVEDKGRSWKVAEEGRGNLLFYQYLLFSIRVLIIILWFVVCPLRCLLSVVCCLPFRYLLQ